MPLDSDSLDSGVSITVSDVVSDYENGASLNDVIYGTDNLSGLDIDTDTETFLQTYTVDHTAYWDGVYAAASSDTPTQPVQEAIRGFIGDVSASALEQQKNFALVVNTAIKDTVAVSGTIEQATVAYLDGQPVGLYYEKATGNFILSTTTPSDTYYIPAGEYMADAAKGVEAAMIYETFKAPVDDAYNATLGDEQAPFDAEKDYLVAASATLVGGAVAGQSGIENPVVKDALFALFGTAGGVTAEQLTSDISATIHDAKVNGLTEDQTLAAVQDQIKSDINANWSATGAEATAILDQAEDVATDIDRAINGLVQGPDAPYWAPAAPIPDPVQGCFTPWASAPLQTSPLVIDLSSGHTGITLTTYDASTTTTFYDLDRTGFAEQTAWVTGDTGLLVQQNLDGSINLFGTSTIDGFTELAKLDSNHNLKIDSGDADWSSLSVWLDANGDGVVEDGELHSLSSLGITSINLAGITPSTSIIDGNQISHTSTVTFSDGSTSEIADAWFTHSTVDTYYTGSTTLDPATMFLPDLRGYGLLPELTISMSQDSTLKDLVSDYATGFNVSGFASATLDSDVASILYEWAGVESVDPSSRGPNVNAQQLEFLEHLFGQDFVQLGSETNPDVNAAADIEQSWNMVLENFEADIQLQAGASNLFANPVTYDPWTGAVSGDLTLSESGIMGLDANAPSPGVSNVAYWENVAHFLDTIKGLDNLTTDENTWMNSAISASDSSLTWDDIKNDLTTDVPGSPISGTAGNDTLTGTAGDDTISGGGGNDTISAGDGNDTINLGTSGSSTVDGGYGNDTINAQNGNNTLIGGYGNDIIHGGSGADTIEGGPGGNTLYGGAGNTTYVFGGGNDLITDSAGTDQIKLPSGITSADLTLTRVQTGSTSAFNDLLISVDGGAGGSIQITGQFSGSYRLETVVFSDSSTLDLNALTSANYTIEGTSGNDTISTGLNTDQVVHGGDGADDIVTGSGNDTLDGGNGNDLLQGGSGNDTYIASPGFDKVSDTGGTDTIQIPTGYSIDDVTFSRHIGTYGPDNDLIIDIRGLGEIQVENQFYSSTYAVENLYFVDGGSTVSLADQTIQTIGTSGNDTLYGITSGVAGNWFDGRGGSDTIVNGTGDNTYVFEAGFGNDTVDSVYHAGTNILQFTGVDSADIIMWTTSNGSLHIEDTTNPSDSITVTAATTGSGTDETAIASYLQEIQFSDGTTWHMSDGLTLTATSSGGGLYGSPYDDTLIGSATTDFLYGNGGNNTLISGGGNDYMYGGSGNNTFEFSSGFSTSYVTTVANAGTNILYLAGIDPDNVIMWTDYNGYLHVEDTTNSSQFIEVYAGTTGSGTDESTIGQHLQEITFDSLYGTTWNLTGGLTLTATSSGGGLYGSPYDDTLIGSATTDFLYGNGGNNTLISGGGNDYMYGGSGNNTFEFSSGFSTSYVTAVANAGINTLHLAGIDPDNVIMWTDYNGYLHVEDTANSSQFIEVYAGTTGSGTDESTIGQHLQEITFDPSYSTTWDLTGALTLTAPNSGGTLLGTGHGDTLNGGTAGDTIYANAGDNTIYGGGGYDSINLGTGADTVLFKGATAETGIDTISNFSTAKGDKIDIADVISTYDPLTMDISHFVELTTSGSSTQLKVDTDGSGTSYTQIATIAGVTGLSLNDLISDGNLIVHHS